jgi:hypothetical protein
VKRLTLELGGKGPNIVLDDADLELAADGTLFGCLMNQGQACESGTRIIVAAAVHDKFVERLIERAKTISIGDPLDPATDFGPVISAEAQMRILRYIDSGRAEGATLAYGGGVPAGPQFERGFWIEPTIFTDVRNDMTIAREEIFGPVLAVIRAESTDQAIRIANDTEYGLSAGVWSTDTQRALDVAGQLEVGTVWVNDWHMVNAAYPFGGYKQAARRNDEQLATPTRAAIRVQEAYGHALDGNERTSQDLLDQAHTCAASDTVGDAHEGHGSYCTPAHIELQRAGCWLALGQPKKAIRLYEQALPDVPVVYQRDRAAALSQLAAAYLADGQFEEAASTTHAALPVARSSRAGRILKEVTGVSAELVPHRSLPAVAALLDDLRSEDA